MLRAISDIFERFNFRKLSCAVVIGNPIEKTYDKLVPKYGGRIVGLEKEEVKLAYEKDKGSEINGAESSVIKELYNQLANVHSY